MRACPALGSVRKPSWWLVVGSGLVNLSLKTVSGHDDTADVWSEVRTATEVYEDDNAGTVKNQILENDTSRVHEMGPTKIDPFTFGEDNADLGKNGNKISLKDAYDYRDRRFRAEHKN